MAETASSTSSQTVSQTALQISSQSVARPALDIELDLQDLVAHYPPAAHDQHHFDFVISDGVVTLNGNVKSRVTHQFLLDKVPEIEGVRDVRAEALANDDDLRLETAKLTPYGVFVNVEYGIVKLTGRLDAGTDVNALVNQIISSVPGIRRIYTAFS